MKKLVLSLAFVGFGTFAMAQQTQQMPPMRGMQDQKEMIEQRQANHLAQMEKDLSLTKAQVAQIQAMQKQHLAQREAQRLENQKMRAQNMQMIKQNRAQMDNDMKKILTPEQFAKWQNNRQQLMQNRQQRFQKSDCPMDCPMNNQGKKGDFRNKMQKPVQK